MTDKKNNSKEYLILLILPVCFFFFSFQLRNLEGPFYNGNADPSYVYLINSANLAQMNSLGPGHVDHPGTPVQLLGAIVIKVKYIFTGDKPSIAEDIVYHPESYQKAIDLTFAVLNSTGLLIMGLLLYSAKKNISVCLFFQTLPFISINILESFSVVKPENMGLCIIVILIGLLFKYVIQEKSSSNKDIYIFLFGILSGLLLAVKISFICLALLPLILIPGIRKRIIFLGLAFVSFIIFVLLAISNFNYFKSWVINLFIYDQRYGKGSPDVININSFCFNLKKIIITEKLFVIIFSITIAILILFFILNKNRKSHDNFISKDLKFLFAIFIAMSVQVILVAKHYSDRYMYPALLLTVPAMYFTGDILYEKYFRKLNVNIFFGSILVLLISFSIYTSMKTIARARYNYTELEKIEDYLSKNYPEAEIIYSNESSAEFPSLILANNYSGENARGLYKSFIDKRFPDGVFYDVYNNKLYNNHPGAPGKKKILQTKHENSLKAFTDKFKEQSSSANVELTKVFSNSNGEMLFEIK